jgi:mannose-6-phosphate isomerase-like protein (cupin superfamily)
MSAMEDATSTARLDLDTDERFVRLRQDLGVSTFGLNQMLLRPGQRGRVHRHQRQEEVYLVWQGELTIALEGEETTLGRGELIRVAPGVRRRLMNRGTENLVLIALGGAEPHDGRDGEAFLDWDDSEPKDVSEVPLPGPLGPDD